MASNSLNNDPLVNKIKSLPKSALILLLISSILLAVLMATIKQYQAIESELTSDLKESHSRTSKLEEDIRTLRKLRAQDKKVIDYHDSVIVEKTYQNRKYTAYSLDGGYEENGQDFIIESDDRALLVSNFYSADYNVDKLFDFFSDTMIVTDMANNSLDVYDMVNGIPYYSGSAELPQYNTGTLYGVTCGQNTCEVSTAFHLEAGCDITFYPNNRTFDIPVCAGGYPAKSYTPAQL